MAKYFLYHRNIFSGFVAARLLKCENVFYGFDIVFNYFRTLCTKLYLKSCIITWFIVVLSKILQLKLKLYFKQFRSNNARKHRIYLFERKLTLKFEIVITLKTKRYFEKMDSVFASVLLWNCLNHITTNATITTYANLDILQVKTKNNVKFLN